MTVLPECFEIVYDFQQSVFFQKKEMGFPLLATAAKSAASIGAGMAAARAAFSRFRGRMAAARGTKGRRSFRRAKGAFAGHNFVGRRNLSFNPPAFQRHENCVLTLAYKGDLGTGTTQNQYGVEHVYRLNSLFDPVEGSETLQPLYFDQKAAVWNRFRVTGVSIEVQWLTADTTNCMACAIKVGNSDDAVTVQGKSIRYVDAMQMADALVIAPAGEHQFIQKTGYLSLAQIEGEKWFTQSSNYDAQVTANPTNAPLLRLSVANLTGSSDVTVSYRIWIYFHCHFFELKTPGESS